MWCYRYHPQGDLYDEARSSEQHRYGGRGYLVNGDVRGANWDNWDDKSAFKMLDFGNLARDTRDFAIRVARPLVAVKYPPIGGLNRPILGGFRPILIP